MSSSLDPSPGRSAPARRSLLVFADSLSYYGPQGGLPADDPRIWPNIVASQMGWDLELIGRIGWTSRDVWWAATQDPRSWAALPRAGAVIFATSGMDSLPSPLPTAMREMIRYVRPPWLRRWVRDGYGWVQPRLSPVARSARTRCPAHRGGPAGASCRRRVRQRPALPSSAPPRPPSRPTRCSALRATARHGTRTPEAAGSTA